MNIGLESDDSLSLGKILNIPSIIIVAEPVWRRQQIRKFISPNVGMNL